MDDFVILWSVWIISAGIVAGFQKDENVHTDKFIKSLLKMDSNQDFA